LKVNILNSVRQKIATQKNRYYVG